MCNEHDQHQSQLIINQMYDALLKFCDAIMWIWCYQCHVIKMRNIINSKWESKFEFQIYGIHISNLKLNAIANHLLKLKCYHIEQSLKFDESVSFQMRSNWINALQINEHALLTKYSFKREKFLMISMKHLQSIWRDLIISKFDQLGNNLSTLLFIQINVLQTQNCMQSSKLNCKQSTFYTWINACFVTTIIIVCDFQKWDLITNHHLIILMMV